MSKPEYNQGLTTSSSMQEKIKEVTRNLLIAHGYHKTTFGVIAKALQITTTNIHYHFGNKNHLVEIVVREYVAEAKKNHSIIWLDTTTTLEQKVAQVVAYNYRLYRKYNPDDKGRHPWSLIGRLRLESDVLSEAACRSLASFTQTMQDVISQAVEYAWQQGQLKADTPRQDLVFLLTNLVDSSSVFAQDAGSFARLEQFFTAFSRVVLSVYTLEPPTRGDNGT
ncbi:TetR family transcriptional regulator [Sodalis praecaptivus]|uniref:TetR family transcriptional regulator n=1 Tax=Sodalis praecaptivus TaxID=1239307 RepID=W0I0G4_9GAMM|nr:TetR/AcrR family transcriptional regulator [Sodalis praecaptivus]AHF78292.1 TetR family transcriptional regulator [Sodalis praecaptivus]